MAAWVQTHGVPIAAVLAPSKALDSAHLNAVGALVDTELAPGVSARVPAGYWAVEGSHVGYRTSAPRLDGDENLWQTTPFAPPATQPVGARPLDGIRVL